MASARDLVVVLLLLPACSAPGGTDPKDQPEPREERMTARAPRKRAREHGLAFGSLPTGEHNAITDVPGVLVGHVTRSEGEAVRTGVTAVLPHAGNPVRRRVPCGISVANGFGKLVGSTQVMELGELESPVVLTSTLNVFRVADGVLDHLLGLPGNEKLRSVNVLVGETNDGRLNDVRARPVTPADAVLAIRQARGGPVDEGCVGAGTGTVCFGWKGGIGTASRKVTAAGGAFVLGALVQTNFGGELTIGGVRVPPPGPVDSGPAGADAAGSCMMVLATDAPMDARQLTRLARRGVLAMARLGSTSDHGSGDYTIAFSTADRPGAHLPEEELSGFFRAAVDALEEAMVNSMSAAETTQGVGGRTVPALPVEDVVRRARGGASPEAATGPDHPR